MAIEQPADVAVVDHRLLNWRFVVPSVPDGLLLLPAADEAGEVPGAVICDPGAGGPGATLTKLGAGPYPAVVLADVGRWAGSRRSGPDLLGRAAAAVAPGGWLYASFANPWYPLRSRSAALTLAAASRAVRREGLQPISGWLAFPDQRTSAYLVPADGNAELAYFMRTFFFPYASGSSARKVRIKQQALTLMRNAALLAPASVRPRFAPAFALVAERPA